MSGKSKYSDEVQNQIAEKYKGGKSAGKIGKELGIAMGKVKGTVERLGVTRDSIDQSSLSKQQKKEIAEKYSPSYGFTKLGREYGIFLNGILKVLEQQGIKRKTSNRKFSEEEELQIVDLYVLKKKGTGSIARKFNCARSTIRRILIGRNITIREQTLTTEEFI